MSSAPRTGSGDTSDDSLRALERTSRRRSGRDELRQGGSRGTVSGRAELDEQVDASTEAPRSRQARRQVGFIDAGGDMVVRGVYDEAGSFFKARASVAVNGKHGLIRSRSHESCPASTTKHSTSGKAWRLVSLGGRWGFIDAVGKTVRPAVYDEAGDLSEGFALRQGGRQVGLHRCRGEHGRALPAYESAGSSQEGRHLTRPGRRKMGLHRPLREHRRARGLR